ncbi:hypothetical protein [Stagnihabitans tardus]|uniref:Uncharacterized protein n=1 Tax=Stagnihabitans tardus TaxID=2699202 RepID=A0AAE4Y9C2_9RHOB|nr:hypothetical protein [Stagnihabitans tardus]NBZ88366.1 hypothetical protein [Stagnihabitans tardus]
MAWDQWTADCGACAALCCIHLPFDEGPDFAHDKPAGKRCRHLAGRDCKLHGQLETKGYPGCARYDCLGAGQRATALGGEAEVFAALRRLHDDHLTLAAAGQLPLPPEAEAERLGLLSHIGASEDLDAAAALAYATSPLPAEVRAFLKGLKPLLSRR